MDQPPSRPLPTSHRFCVAPMMDYTDRHFRYLLRLLSRRARLYTEMVTAAALVRGRDPERFLDFNAAEHPLALQLGGSEPALLAAAVRMAAAHGYDEVNLNVGCPSDRVQAGRFGACLMAEPDLVAECVAAMHMAAAIPITVKTRIGIDNRNDDAPLDILVSKVAAAGCSTIIVHARNAWLQGLSPKENREIPPLNYERVHRLKRSFPQLTVILNGGLRTLDEAVTALAPRNGIALNGVMLGRAACDTPFLLAHVDTRLFNETTLAPDRAAIATLYIEYAARMVAADERPHHVLRHAAALFHGVAGARRWRQAVTKAGQSAGDLGALADLAREMAESEPLAA